MKKINIKARENIILVRCHSRESGNPERNWFPIFIGNSGFRVKHGMTDLMTQ